VSHLLASGVMLCCLTTLAMMLILHGLEVIAQAALASSQAALPCFGCSLQTYLALQADACTLAEAVLSC